jgi:hypothetical protein
MRPRLGSTLYELPEPRQLGARIFAQMQPENAPLLADERT